MGSSQSQSTYWGAGAYGVLAQLWAFCAANEQMCGNALSWRIFEADMGTKTYGGITAAGTLPPAVRLDLLACGGMSFTARTKVLTANGKMIAIGMLKVGDRILATRVGTGKTSAKRIAAVPVHFRHQSI
ncbi:MAG TPA: hypothetical protein VF784_05860 [Anaerolineales bacterium]